MPETLLNIAVAAAILISAGLITQWVTRAMYYRCGACGTLNAKRRDRCRDCGAPLAG